MVEIYKMLCVKGTAAKARNQKTWALNLKGTHMGKVMLT